MREREGASFLQPPRVEQETAGWVSAHHTDCVTRTATSKFSLGHSKHPWAARAWERVRSCRGEGEERCSTGDPSLLWLNPP